MRPDWCRGVGRACFLCVRTLLLHRPHNVALYRSNMDIPSDLRRRKHGLGSRFQSDQLFPPPLSPWQQDRWKLRRSLLESGLISAIIGAWLSAITVWGWLKSSKETPPSSSILLEIRRLAERTISLSISARMSFWCQSMTLIIMALTICRGAT